MYNKRYQQWFWGSSALLVGLLLIPSLYAQTPSVDPKQGKPMTEQQTISNKPVKIEYHLAKLTPRCVGRVLINVPEDFETQNENRASKIDKILISSKSNISQNGFSYLLKKREEKFKQKDEDIAPLDRPFLKETYALHDGYDGVIYNRNQGSSVDALRTLEANIWRNNVAITAEINADDTSSKRYDEGRKKHPELYTTNIPQQRQILEAVLKRLKGWDGVNIPKEPGSCYGHVYVTGPDNFYEDTGDFWIYNKNDNLQFSLSVDTETKEKDTMLERVGNRQLDSDQELIRRRVVPLPLMPNAHAEEYIMTNSRGEHDFLMLANEKVGSSKTPYIMVVFNDRGLLSKADALKIWDAIIPTIRMRPGAF